MRSSVVVPVLALMALVAGCSHDDRAPARSARDVAPQAAVHDPTVSPSSDPRATREVSPTLEPGVGSLERDRPFTDASAKPDSQVLAKTEKPLSDAEVLGVALAANDGEVQLADIALKKASADNVKQFAAMMKSHHNTALAKARSLETKTKITNAESDVSAFLKNDVAATSKDLKDKDGRSFDRAYIDSQVQGHKDVLTILDNRLLPSAQNGEIKSMLIEMRRTVTDHLTKVESLQRKLDTTATLPHTIAPGMPGHAAQPAAGKHAMTAGGR